MENQELTRREILEIVEMVDMWLYDEYSEKFYGALGVPDYIKDEIDELEYQYEETKDENILDKINAMKLTNKLVYSSN